MQYYSRNGVSPGEELLTALQKSAQELDRQRAERVSLWLRQNRATTRDAVLRYIDAPDTAESQRSVRSHVMRRPSLGRRRKQRQRTLDNVASLFQRFQWSNPDDRQVITSFHDAGALLPMVNFDKTPVNRAWNKGNPSLERTLAHYDSGGMLGVVPATIGYTVVDVDTWSARGLGRLLALFPPDLVTPSQKGFHLWYRDNAPRRPRAWHLLACSGDVIGDDSYVVLWNGPRTLYQLSVSGSRRYFPASVWSALPRPVVWESRKPADHSSEAQRRRGVNSGVARRQLKGVRAGIAIRMDMDGASRSFIAGELGVSERTVRNYLTGDDEPVVDAAWALKWLRRLLKDDNPGRIAVRKAIARAETNLWGGTGGEVAAAGSPVNSGSVKSSPVNSDVRVPASGTLNGPRCSSLRGSSVPCGCCYYNGGSPDDRPKRCSCCGAWHYRLPPRRPVLLNFYRRLAVSSGNQQGAELCQRAIQRYCRSVKRKGQPEQSAFIDYSASAVSEIAAARVGVYSRDFTAGFDYARGMWRRDWETFPVSWWESFARTA